MIKKMVITLMSMCFISLALNGMELQTLEKKNNESNSINMHLNLGPDLLNRQNLTDSSGGARTPITPITGLHEVEGLIKTRSTLVRKRTIESSSKTTRNTRLDSGDNCPDQVRIDMSDINRSIPKLVVNDIAPDNAASANGLQELLEEKKELLDEQEKWELLEKFNPKVYNFAKSHGRSFDDAELYAELLQQCPIEPQAVVEYIKHTNQLKEKNGANWEIKHYKDMKKTDPEKYADIQLGLMKEVFDKEDGQEKPSAVHNEHLAVQEKKIAEQGGYLKKSMIAHVLHILITIGSLAWATTNEVLVRVPHGNTSG